MFSSRPLLVGSPLTGAGVGAPQIVQALLTQGNMANQSTAGNSYVFTLPHPVGSGNCLLVKSAWNSPGATGVTLSSLVDSINGTWAAPQKTCAGANNTTDIFIRPNCGSGKTTFTVTYSANMQGPMFSVFEISGIATTSPMNGSSFAADQTRGRGGTPLQCGSFTPADAGSIVFAFFDCSTGNFANGNASSFTPSSGFNAIHTDNGWTGIGNAGLSKAASWQLQSTATAVNPGMTPTGNTTDPYNCVAVSLKPQAGAGTPRPSGIKIYKMTMFFNAPQITTWNMQWPTIGNLRVLMTASRGTSLGFDSVTDSEGNSWNFAPSDNTPPNDTTAQIWYWPNAAANSNLTVTGHRSSSPSFQEHAMLFDIVGAAISPFGANAFTTTATTGNVNQPNFTSGLQQAGSLVLCYGPIGLGPCISLDAPTNGFFDTVTYTGGTQSEQDANTYASGDGWGHFQTTSAQASGSSVSMTWTTFSGNDIIAHAAEFKHA